MPRTNGGRCSYAIAILAVAFLGTATAYGQLGHRIVHDWTVGLTPRPVFGSGYAPDFRRIGLVEFDGDVDGTYISWGFGGVMTDWSATTIAAAVGAAFAILLVAGGLTLATFGRRKGNPSRDA